MNLPKLIAYHMRQSMKNKKAKTLPYGMFVTHMMNTWGYESSNAQDDAVPGLRFDIDGISHFGLKLDKSDVMNMKIVYRNKRGPIEDAGDNEINELFEESSKAARKRKGKGKMGASSDTEGDDMESFKSEMRTGLKEVKKNQGILAKNQRLLAKGLNAILKAITCQGKGTQVNEPALRNITLIEMENDDEDDNGNGEAQEDDEDEEGFSSDNQNGGDDGSSEE